MAIISKVKSFLQKGISLKIWIFVLLAFFGLVPYLMSESSFIDRYEEKEVSRISESVRTQCEIIANKINSSDYIKNPTSEVINTQLNQLAGIYNGRIYVADDAYSVIFDSYSINVGKILAVEQAFKCFKGEASVLYNNENKLIEIFVPIYNSEGTDIIGIIGTDISTEVITNNIYELHQKNLLIKHMIIMVVLFISVILSNVIVRPFNNMIDEVETQFGGYGSGSVEIRSYKETSQLSESINKMITRMNVLDESRQEFVSNVSHELKTPITSMKVLAESLVMQEGTPIEMYQEFMTDIISEIDRESNIIDDLLSLVKLDKTSAALNIVTVDLNKLLELILKRLHPIAEKKGIEMLFVSERQVTLDGDEIKLTLALSNFIENAIKYNVASGSVRVNLDADHKDATIIIEDTGIGIPEDEIEHIFERFYRIDKSHSQEIQGTGLGLAIARSAILMHRGSVDVDSIIGRGTKFIIRIPLIYIS